MWDLCCVSLPEKLNVADVQPSRALVSAKASDYQMRWAQRVPVTKPYSKGSKYLYGIHLDPEAMIWQPLSEAHAYSIAARWTFWAQGLLSMTTKFLNCGRRAGVLGVCERLSYLVPLIQESE